MNRKIILAGILQLVCLQLLAQTFTGKVVDNKNNGIAQVNIYTNTRINHTHSDDAGNFTIDDIKEGDTLIISLLGYQSVVKRVNDLTKLMTIKLDVNSVQLSDIRISNRPDALNLFSDVNIKTAPMQNSQEVLTKVPGLMIGQHAGGGKAEQLFLRGFDIDHGTDVAISVENMPVNMVSHAHGQGYADLHFVIPETIEKINFGKGPYDAEKGNFTTAGYVDLKLKDQLNENLIKIEGGQFNTKRFVGLINLLNTDKQSAYIATEYNKTDGPFTSSQNFGRTNFLARYKNQLSENSHMTISASHFTSQWDASGQVPNRAVENNTIGRFGAIDDTEGGNTSRSNVWMDYTTLLGKNDYVKTNFFYSNYKFELFSNFTYFLEDSVNGDQIRQYEDRNLFGGQVEYGKNIEVLNKNILVKTGVGYRNDQSMDNELSHTKNRQTTLIQYQYGDINETNISAFVNAEIELGKFLIQPGLRADNFSFNYYDKLATSYNPLSQESTILSPKLNILYNYSPDLQLYLKNGKGFHSNDSRVVLNRNDKKNLPSAYGTDLGMIWRAHKNLIINAAVWQLYLEQEFVYVGDAGIIEPSGQTQRSGVDISMRYQPLKWLYLSGDVNYAYAKALNTEAGEDYIPLAATFTSQASAQVIHPSGWFGGLRMRHIGDRAANEDYSIVAKGYTVFDGNVGYGYKKIECGINVKNVLNVAWNETQFATTSRLQGEPAPIEEIHFTPGTPFALSAYLAFKF